MKIVLNGDIKPEVIDSLLTKQKNKMDKIDKFCKDNKIEELSYKDSELEYEYKNNVAKVETRPKQQSKEVRGG